MLRGSYLTAGDRFTVRVGGVVVGIGKVAVQDAWSRGGPRQEARNAGHKRPFAALEGEWWLTVKTRRRSHATREGQFLGGLWGGECQTTQLRLDSIHPWRRTPASPSSTPSPTSSTPARRWPMTLGP